MADPTTSPASKLSNWITVLESARKLMVSLLIILVSCILLYGYLKNAFTRQLLIRPFKVSARLSGMETNGELLTSSFIEKIRAIQATGASLYHEQKIVLPAWENRFDEINVAMNNSIFAEAKSLLQYVGSTKVKYASAEVTMPDSGLSVRFSFDNHVVTASGGRNLDSLLTALAEASLSYLDPFTLATYYLKTGKLKESGMTIQSLLNDNLPENDGIALHLEGLLHLAERDTAGAKRVFQKALTKLQTPWLTYNNLGVIFFSQHQFDSARYLYKKVIAANPHAHFGYLNFANLLYSTYSETKGGADNQRHRLAVLDSAIYYYRQAIACEKTQPKLYIALLPALFDRQKMVEFQETADKLSEMSPDDLLVPLQVGLIYRRAGMQAVADSCFAVARTRCMGDSIKITQLNFYIGKSS